MASCPRGFLPEARTGFGGSPNSARAIVKRKDPNATVGQREHDLPNARKFVFTSETSGFQPMGAMRHGKDVKNNSAVGKASSKSSGGTAGIPDTRLPPE
ncbi:hypothetical protein C2857_006926 [Epichloe festucae Fl1]|uniref:Uncharacterized protein n=1 Tax=Epichloe festucae (strain Fl1) TaxID=877507 RepID=A0A7S9KQP6_EPIFF|nr:hypothetical protein C2857_006926 [Epichloe festucae Fl1]